MNVATLIRVIDWAYLVTSLAGISVSIWAHRDWRTDRALELKAGLNGLTDLTARMGLRDTRVVITLHVLFLTLGLSAVLGPLPPVNRWPFVIGFGVAFIVVQGSAVEAQIHNQIDRIRLRRKLELRERELGEDVAT